MRNNIYVIKENDLDIFPATVTDAIGHDQMQSSLTNLITKYNLSVCWPDKGLNGGSLYDLSTAINLLNKLLLPEQKFPGVCAEFTNKDNKFEQWEFIGSSFEFNNINGWIQRDSSIINELMKEVFPVTASLSSDLSIVRTKHINKIKFTWKVSRKGKNVTSDSELYFNGSRKSSDNEVVTINETSHKNITYTFTGKYKGISASASKTINVVDDCYYGIVNPDWSLNADTIKNFNKTSLKNSKYFNWSSINITNKRFCYSYPSYFGELASIKDGNNFEYINSYSKDSLVIDGVNYLVYTLIKPTTVSGFKQIYN